MDSIAKNYCKRIERINECEYFGFPVVQKEEVYEPGGETHCCGSCAFFEPVDYDSANIDKENLNDVGHCEIEDCYCSACGDGNDCEEFQPGDNTIVFNNDGYSWHTSGELETDIRILKARKLRMQDKHKVNNEDYMNGYIDAFNEVLEEIRRFRRES